MPSFASMSQCLHTYILNSLIRTTESQFLFGYTYGAKAVSSKQCIAHVQKTRICDRDFSPFRKLQTSPHCRNMQTQGCLIGKLQIFLGHDSKKNGRTYFVWQPSQTPFKAICICVLSIIIIQRLVSLMRKAFKAVHVLLFSRDVWDAAREEHRYIHSIFLT